MSTPIQHKRNSSSGVAPEAIDLQPGEIAINTADGKLFTRAGSQVVQFIPTVVSDTEPSSPVEGMIWVDTSQ